MISPIKNVVANSVGGMPQDKCSRADGDVSDNSTFALSSGVVGDKNSTEKDLFEQRRKNKETERQNNRHWMIDNAHRKQSCIKADGQRCANINRQGYKTLERCSKGRNSEPS